MAKYLHLAAGLTVGLASSSFAQSSVTAFGIVDVAVTTVKNGSAGRVNSLASSGNLAGRWGLRGTEDLGGGTSASFWLESALAADTGVGGNVTVAPGNQLFDRRATVSIASASLGEIRLGRDHTPTFSLWIGNDPFSYVGVASPVSLFGQTTSTVLSRALGAPANASPIVRISNAVQYFLPSTLGGVYGNVMVSAGEGGTVAGGSTRANGGRLGYRSGPFDASVAHLVTKNAPLDDFKDTAIGVAYTFDWAKLILTRREFRYATAKQATTVLAVSKTIGQGTLKLSLARADQSGSDATNAPIDANDASLIGIGYVYDLSKRTALYASAGRISNSGGARFAIVGGPAGLLAGESATGVQMGVRTSF